MNTYQRLRAMATMPITCDADRVRRVRAVGRLERDLFNAGDDIKRLWEAASKLECPCNACACRASDCKDGCEAAEAWADIQVAVDMLRPLFGEVTR